ncbi:hypothetical protein EON65_13905 [archaeon]|nr:MAG: hypothetical protein EON65_13905 [archaeon]
MLAYEWDYPWTAAIKHGIYFITAHANQLNNVIDITAILATGQISHHLLESESLVSDAILLFIELGSLLVLACYGKASKILAFYNISVALVSTDSDAMDCEKVHLPFCILDLSYTQSFYCSSHITTQATPPLPAATRSISIQAVVGARNSFAVALYDFSTHTLSVYALCLRQPSIATTLSSEGSAHSQPTIHTIEDAVGGAEMAFVALAGEEIHVFQLHLPFPLDLTVSYDPAVLLVSNEHIAHAQLLSPYPVGLLLSLLGSRQDSSPCGEALFIMRRETNMPPLLLDLQSLLAEEGGVVIVTCPASAPYVHSLARGFAYLCASLSKSLPSHIKEGGVRIEGAHFLSPFPSPSLQALSSRYVLLCCSTPRQPLLLLYDLSMRMAIRLSLLCPSPSPSSQGMHAEFFSLEQQSTEPDALPSTSQCVLVRLMQVDSACQHSYLVELYSKIDFSC